MTDQTPIRSLAARYYTDPAIYDAERAGLFQRAWLFAGHASQVKDPGDYFAFSLAGEDLFCVRAHDGEIRCFYNVCQHRAHQLVTGAGTTRTLVCPYHAWTYELTGGLRSGPNIRAVPGFDRSEICLTSIRVENFLGVLFINFDPDAEPMEAWFPNARAELEAWVPDWQALAPMDWVEIPENCNWKVSVENYSECYHCSLNHKAFATGIIRPETYDIQPQGYCLRHTTECQNLDQMSYAIDTAVPNATGYSSWFFWPGFSFQVYPGNILNTYHWRPDGPGKVTVWRGWYTKGGVEDPDIRALAVADRETTVAEDITLVESVQRGLNSRGYRPGPLVVDPACGVNSEHSVLALQTWMREAVDGPA